MEDPPMAQDHESTASLKGADHITLDQLISATSTSVLRALKEHEANTRPVINPRIWVGIWIDLERFRDLGGPVTGPVGGPVGGAGGVR
jgi:hypothetical protein